MRNRRGSSVVVCGLAVSGLVVAVTSGAACRNTVTRPAVPDAGPVVVGGDEGEGEGDGEGEGECPAADRPGLSVRVVDAATRFTLCDEVAVRVVDGDFDEVAVAVGEGEACRHQGAQGRPGTYDLTVEGDGYQSRSDEIVVDADDCGHPRAIVQVQIELTPG